MENNNRCQNIFNCFSFFSIIFQAFVVSARLFLSGGFSPSYSSFSIWNWFACAVEATKTPYVLKSCKEIANTSTFVRILFFFIKIVCMEFRNCWGIRAFHMCTVKLCLHIRINKNNLWKNNYHHDIKIIIWFSISTEMPVFHMNCSLN